ncbi:hypothetical protein [Telmatospirillum sp.]|uniref:hypothetical protein n=1 Tax=Telmatospirillum sp. TaxID=2079197 RepID=UPI0028426DD3|nr:hypothetical protein [Telmatospirillum sp.]MDR3435884.1 hypothetical protein [Telmatospirillum sp.]
MALPQLPPPIDIPNETKRGVIDGLKKVIEVFQAKGILGKEISYKDVIHNPDILFSFIQTYKANAPLAEKIVVGKDGKPVTDPDAPLVCGINLAQIQQLLVKTCARYFLEQDTREEEEIVTETVTKTRFLFFKTTEQVERVTGGGFDQRKVRDISRYMAFDWQLPLLSAYAELSSAQLLELGENIVALNSAEGIREFAKFDQPTIKKAKATAGADFVTIVAVRPAAVGGIATWSKDMYGFYRQALGDDAFEFFCRDKAFYMVCAALEKPAARIYGDVLCYIAADNLEEMERLNMDKADVLIAAMKLAFGNKIRAVLSRPAFAKDVLRKLVESLLHVEQEKSQLAISAQITCKAIAPQVFEWLAKQPPLES